MQRSKKDWSTPTSSSFTLISKDDDHSNNPLKLVKNQVKLFESLQEQKSSRTTTGKLDSYRKLREAVYSTDQYSVFSITVYEKCILEYLKALQDPSFLAANDHSEHLYQAELHKSLLQIVQSIYPNSSLDISQENQDEMFDRAKFSAFYILHLITLEKTRIPVEHIPKSLLEDTRISNALKLAKNFLSGNLNYFLIERIWSNLNSESKFLLKMILPAYRARVAGILTKAYLSLPMDFFGKYLLFETEDETSAWLSGYFGSTFSKRLGNDSIIKLKSFKKSDT